jgi:hypothetical protein
LIGFKFVAGVDKNKERLFKNGRKKDFKIFEIDRFDLSFIRQEIFGNFKLLVFLFFIITAIIVNLIKGVYELSGK